MGPRSRNWIRIVTITKTPGLQEVKTRYTRFIYIWTYIFHAEILLQRFLGPVFFFWENLFSIAPLLPPLVRFCFRHYFVYQHCYWNVQMKKKTLWNINVPLIEVTNHLKCSYFVLFKIASSEVYLKVLTLNYFPLYLMSQMENCFEWIQVWLDFLLTLCSPEVWRKTSHDLLQDSSSIMMLK